MVDLGWKRNRFVLAAAVGVPLGAGLFILSLIHFLTTNDALTLSNGLRVHEPHRVSVSVVVFAVESVLIGTVFGWWSVANLRAMRRRDRAMALLLSVPMSIVAASVVLVPMAVVTAMFSTYRVIGNWK